MPVDLFRFDTAASVAHWSAIDDRVMGGVSTSRMRHDPAGHAWFEGLVSLQRGGGFASVRCAVPQPGVGGASGYLLEVYGDGKRYKLSLRTDDALDGVSYQARFEPARGQWSTLFLPLPAFVPGYRGCSGGDAPVLDPCRVRQFGLLIADRQEGAFALALRAIRAQ